MIKERSTSNSLVILTTHFGLNFSGGSTATHEIFVHLQNKFSQIVVVCNKIGYHRFDNVEFRLYNSHWEAYKILRYIKDENTVYYGDFYNSILFAWAKKRFYFTFHDNWPEMKNTSLADYFKSIIYIPIYKTILRSAEKVIAVSKFKMRYIKKFNQDVKVVYNGYNDSKDISLSRINEKNKILMVGNIDRRKYHIAIRLFKILGSGFNTEIDIYGNIIDNRLAKILNAMSFINIKGFVNPVPYRKYKCLLHTSMIENLPIAICESIKHNVPVVAFNVGGISEVINPANGILVHPFDIEEMKNSIESILSGDREFLFSKNSMVNFDWEIASKEYLRIMQL